MASNIGLHNLPYTNHLHNLLCNIPSQPSKNYKNKHNIKFAKINFTKLKFQFLAKNNFHFIWIAVVILLIPNVTFISLIMDKNYALLQFCCSLLLCQATVQQKLTGRSRQSEEGVSGVWLREVLRREIALKKEVGPCPPLA